MKGISVELRKSIEHEVMIKNANDEARSNMKTKRPITRSSIEDILAARELDDIVGEL